MICKLEGEIMISTMNNQVRSNTSFGSIIPIRAFQIGRDYAVDEKLCASAAKNLVAVLKGRGKDEDVNPAMKKICRSIRKEFADKDPDYGRNAYARLYHSQKHGVFAVLTGKQAERLRSVGSEIANARGVSDDIVRSYQDAEARSKYGEIVSEIDKKLENWWDLPLTVFLEGRRKESGCVLPRSISLNEKNPPGRDEFLSYLA